MQLIHDSEPTLAINRDMSAIEDIHTEKVGNGDIEQLNEKNYNGNKENINGDVKVITNDETNKQVINAEIETLPNLSNDGSETEDESSVRVPITGETCEVNITETNSTQKEESQRNGTDEEIQSTSSLKRESEGNAEETVQEAIVEDEEDIIRLKHENVDQISDTAEAIVEDEEDTIRLKQENVDQIPNTAKAIVEDEEDTITLKQENVDQIPDTAEAIVEDEEDIISLKQKNVDQIPDTAENESEKDRPENDETKIKEELPTKDDVEVIEEPDVVLEEPVPDLELEEPVPDIELEEPARPVEKDDKHLESSENEDKPLESTDNKDKHLDENKDEIEAPVCDSTEKILSNDAGDSPPMELKYDMDVKEVEETTKSKEQDTSSQPIEKPSAPVSSIIDKPVLCKLSNTLDILSDDEDEPQKEEPPKPVDLNEKQCINIEDDDDIMLIDEDTTKTETPQPVVTNNKEDTPINTGDKTDSETGEKTVEDTGELFTKTDEKDSTIPEEIQDNSLQINVNEKEEAKPIEHISSEKPLLPDNFLKSAKKNLSDMTREDLEEFCILKIVESIVDRSNLSEIKNKLKSVAQGIDEYRKKAAMLTKQNRDLQVVLKSIQEEQKKMSPGTPITPLKITRSVGMQVFMEKTGARRKNLAQLQNSTNTRQCAKSLSGTNLRPQKPPATQPIPVPRLVPASPAMKSPSTIPLVNQITPVKNATPMPNGIKNPSPSQKVAEKRQHNRIMSVTVDLTDDEPPAKVNNRTSPAPPVRVVPAQTLMANPRQAFPAAVSSPRKVYIPISGPQNQNIRPGQTIMLKTVPTPSLRPRCPTPQVARQPAGSVRANRVQTGRHPAPLPDAMKQYQPPNWKALPPAPDLKLSKVENGIVISWKIEGYLEDSYEEIASYQLYAYQETTSPPSTALWKKIGDVKALPLPMACTLTQFMAGFKYFFAVRAVDIRSRLGPFSLPGSILLLNKL